MLLTYCPKTQYNEVVCIRLECMAVSCRVRTGAGRAYGARLSMRYAMYYMCMVCKCAWPLAARLEQEQGGPTERGCL